MELETLKPRFENVKSYCNRAVVEYKEGFINLYSYNLLVCTYYNISNDFYLYDDWDFSKTTIRHVKEFLCQMGYKNLTTEELGGIKMGIETIQKINNIEVYKFNDIEELQKELDIFNIYEQNLNLFEDFLNMRIEDDINFLIEEFIRRLNKYKHYEFILNIDDFKYNLNINYARSDKIYLSTNILSRFIFNSGLNLVENMGFWFSHGGGGICNLNSNLNDILEHNTHIYKYEYEKLEKFFKLYEEFLNKWIELFYRGDYMGEFIKRELDFLLFEEDYLLTSDLILIDYE